MHKIALLNTTILTGGEGTYSLKAATLPEIKALLNSQDEGVHVRTSYIGHESTAQIMSTLLGIPVEQSRAQFTQDRDTVAICFKLNGRPEEGKILMVAEIEAIGYEWFILKMI